MIGHKYNMKELVLDLKGENIKYTTTEFCQGRVTRWGLAWTYHEYDIFNLGDHLRFFKFMNMMLCIYICVNYNSSVHLSCIHIIIINSLYYIYIVNFEPFYYSTSKRQT